jgi:hypothetical protein
LCFSSGFFSSSVKKGISCQFVYPEEYVLWPNGRKQEQLADLSLDEYWHLRNIGCDIGDADFGDVNNPSEVDYGSNHGWIP